MVYTGCRTSEAAGLTCGDVVLEGNLPYIRFAPNNLRGLDKGSLTRNFPIPGPLLDHLREHKQSLDHASQSADYAEKPFFGRYGPTNAYDNVSNQLRDIVRNKMGIKDTSLVPYSTRHTFKDRGRASGVSPSVYDYLQGHVTSQTSRIAQGYGTGFPLESLVGDVDKILPTKDWGNTVSS